MKLGETLRSAAIVAGILTISFFLHTRWCGTPFNITDKAWQEMVDFHLNNYPYDIRVLTTQSTLTLHDWFGMSLKTAFGTIQFTLMALLGLSFFRFLRRLEIEAPWAEIGLASLMLALPIFFAISEPIHTWDDIWGYLFLTLCATALVSRRLFLAAFWFLATCFAREQTLIYFPAFAAGALHLAGKAGRRRAMLAVAMPLVIYGIFLAVVWQNPVSDRYQLILFNFDGFLRTRDSIYSIFMAFGWLWAGWLLALRWKPGAGAVPEYYRVLKWGTLYAVPLTLVFGVGFTLVRETRILFPPAIIVIPFVIMYLQERLPRAAGSLFSGKRLPVAAILILALFGLGILLGHVVFPNFEYRACPDFSRLWAGVQFGVILALVWMLAAKRLARRAA